MEAPAPAVEEFSEHCKVYGGMDDSRFGKPMPWIGSHMATSGSKDEDICEELEECEMVALGGLHMATSGSKYEEICVELEECEMVAFMQQQLRCNSLGDERRYEPSIFRIPSGIRQVNENAFHPQIISIGPYHDGNIETRLKTMQKYKWRYLKSFIARNPDKRLNDYFVAIKSSIDRARKYYSEDVDMDNDHFIRLLLLDGSFIVELMLMIRDERHADREVVPFDHIMDTRWTFAFLLMDLFKLENQVPFFVLQVLHKLVDAVPTQRMPSTEPQSITDIIFDLVTKLAEGISGNKVEIKKPSPEEEIHHLLHFCHICFFSGRGNPSQHDNDIETIPTVQELTKAGVKIKKKETGGMLEVNFCRGVMEMTPVHLNDWTTIYFQNALAFEQCYEKAGVYMMGYSIFLDTLIDTSADVLLLRQSGVLRNGLGSDKELAQAVSRLCYNMAPNHPESVVRMNKDVNNYCNNRWPTWHAKLVDDYFSNPWAIMSLIAAVVLLLFTGIQTVFSVLSYLHGNPGDLFTHARAT